MTFQEQRVWGWGQIGKIAGLLTTRNDTRDDLSSRLVANDSTTRITMDDQSNLLVANNSVPAIYQAQVILCEKNSQGQTLMELIKAEGMDGVMGIHPDLKEMFLKQLLVLQDYKPTPPPRFDLVLKELKKELKDTQRIKGHPKSTK